MSLLEHFNFCSAGGAVAHVTDPMADEQAENDSSLFCPD